MSITEDHRVPTALPPSIRVRLAGPCDCEALAGLLIQPSLKSMFSFGLLILVLLFRPQGLVGKRT